MSRIDETMDALAGAKYFSTLDLASGYWQVERDERDREKSACVPPQGRLYEFMVMPFGLSGAPSTFQRIATLAGLQWEICLIYLDDVIVDSSTFDDHIKALQLVFERFKQAGLKMQPSTFQFVSRKVSCLGHLVSEHGVETDPHKVKAVKEWPIPLDVSELRQFLGLATYYRKVIKDFAKIATPLNTLLQKQ